MVKVDDSVDLALALELDRRLNNVGDPDHVVGITENAIIPKNRDGRDYRPKTLIDRTLELIDPTPNIYTLFMQFNARYFWNKLLPVEVKWSNRMTTCAGVCSFVPQSRQCTITLSSPLLKLRPRKDLVETLLHEMIHGYLFLTNNNRDRDGHGPEFHKHMYRINEEAGTKITVYHDFHDEVRLYQQHWWRCDGPCQKRPPYFGTVRRAMNRKPGPSDFWWAEHQRTCGGQYIKIREPEKPEPKGKSKTNGKKKPDAPKTKDISDWFTKDGKSKNVSTTVPAPVPAKSKSVPDTNGQGTGAYSVSTPNSQPSIDLKGNTTSKLGGFSKTNTKKPPTGLTKLGNNTNNVHGWGVGSPNGEGPSTSNGSKGNTKKPPTGLTKLGNSTNNVHGWGVGGPNGAGPSTSKPPTMSAASKFNSVAVLGGAGTGRSNLLDKFSPETTSSSRSRQIWQVVQSSSPDVIQSTPPQKRKSSGQDVIAAKQPKLNEENAAENVNCPVCDKLVTISKLNDHLDACLANNIEEKHSTPKESVSKQDDSVIFVSPVVDSPIVIDSSTCSEIANSSDSIYLDSLDKDAPNNTSLIETDSRKCLVCDSIIDPNVTLNDHLEVCIGICFDDESISNASFDNDDESLEEDQTDEKKYPCPICMELIKENLMNQHLDTCLNKDLLKDFVE